MASSSRIETAKIDFGAMREPSACKFTEAYAMKAQTNKSVPCDGVERPGNRISESGLTPSEHRFSGQDIVKAIAAHEHVEIRCYHRHGIEPERI